MREKKTRNTFLDPDEKKSKHKDKPLPSKPVEELEIEYGNILVNLFGIEFYTPDTPLKKSDTIL